MLKRKEPKGEAAYGSNFGVVSRTNWVFQEWPCDEHTTSRSLWSSSCRMVCAMLVSILLTVSIPMVWFAACIRSTRAVDLVVWCSAIPKPICLGVSLRPFDTPYTMSWALLQTFPLTSSLPSTPPSTTLYHQTEGKGRGISHPESPPQHAPYRSLSKKLTIQEYWIIPVGCQGLHAPFPDRHLHQ